MKPKEMEAGRETNVKIATDVMKWSYWDFEGDYEGAFPMFTYVGESALSVYFDHGDQHIWFDPSHDIAAAWMVVEKMIADGWDVDVAYENWNEVEGEPLEYYWRAFLNFYTDVAKDHRHAYAEGDTAPLAICRAALMAVEARE